MEREPFVEGAMRERDRGFGKSLSTGVDSHPCGLDQTVLQVAVGCIDGRRRLCHDRSWGGVSGNDQQPGNSVPERSSGSTASPSPARADPTPCTTMHRRRGRWSVLPNGRVRLGARSDAHPIDAVPGKASNQPEPRGVGAWLADPVRERYRTFRCADDAVRGHPPEVS